MTFNDFSNKHANFYVKLNSLFLDELVLAKPDCFGL